MDFEHIKHSVREYLKRKDKDLVKLALYAEKHEPQGLDQNKEVARMGGHAAKVAREDIEKNLGESVVTKQNRLNYEYKDELEIEAK